MNPINKKLPRPDSSCVYVCVFTAVPAAPVNVSVTQLRAHSAMVTWNVPQGDTVIGYSISQQVRSAVCVLIRSLCTMGKPGALPHQQGRAGGANAASP